MNARAPFSPEEKRVALGIAVAGLGTVLIGFATLAMLHAFVHWLGWVP